MIIKIKVTPELLKKQAEFLLSIWGNEAVCDDESMLAVVKSIVSNLYLEASMDDMPEGISVDDLPY